MSSKVSPEKRADWRRVEQLYKQCSEILDDPERENVLAANLVSALAESIGRVFAAYDGLEDEFIDDLLTIFTRVEGRGGSEEERFRHFYNDSRFNRLTEYTTSATNQRRRPTPFEAAVETARRLRDLNRIRDLLYDIPTSCILGGSTSYGRFFNTVGAREDKASDLDLLLVVGSYEELDDVLDSLGHVHGVSGVDRAQERAARFPAIRAEPLENGERCIFSHKLGMWNQTSDNVLGRFQMPSYFKLSLHVFSTDDLDFLILRDIPILGENLSRSLWDYRDTEPTRQDNQRCFAGIDVTVPRKSKKVKDGWLAESRVCHTEDDRYYPGLHQNVVLPQFDLRWEMPRHRLTLPLFTFRWKIVERLREERRLRPFELQTISQSHTRSAVFAPHIVSRVDSYE